MERLSGRHLCLLCFLLLSFWISVPVGAAIKPAANCGQISAQGARPGLIEVKAALEDEVNSLDDYYYLFEVNAVSDKLVRSIARVNKAEAIGNRFSFSLKLSGDSSYALIKYCLAVKTGTESSVKSYTRISPTTFVKNPEKASLSSASYKRGATKKGLQGTDFSHLMDTGSKNCFINLNVSTVLSMATQSFTYGEETYAFNPLHGYTSLVSRCNSSGIPVTLQLMLDAGSPGELMANGGAGGASYYAFNVSKKRARKWMDAMFSYLSILFGQNSCYVSNWILGNEVNSSYPYYYMGQVSLEEFAQNYALTFRDLYNAVKVCRGSSKVFICLEHCWTVRNNTQCSFPGKTLLSCFTQELEALQPGVEWNLAYHPYPVNIKNPTFWNEPVEDSGEAQIFTPLNLRSLTRYIQQTYGKDVRIILSEIGFHSGAGESLQAAGIALAYCIAACNPMVDAIHFRSYEDEAGDASYGVTFGINGKEALSVFRVMDTKGYLSLRRLLEKRAGRAWTSLVPGYNPARMYTNFHNE